MDRLGSRVQIGEDQARLDRLAEPDLVGEQQPRRAARRRQGWLELVVEQVDAGGRGIPQVVRPAIVGEQRAQAEHPPVPSDRARPRLALGGLQAVERRKQRPPDAEVRGRRAHQPARPTRAVVHHFDDAPAAATGLDQRAGARFLRFLRHRIAPPLQRLPLMPSTAAVREPLLQERLLTTHR